ncbi:hypothetical protein A3H26_01910 [candidate division WWE3 bacterium RIFCSPLOWO2_12_FULL_36_10]|uniref:30S ribosomal protein S27ae n=1 Tax=candidate division WWE3 bacterium RIFCSPLOWO2_12_FULL_36_10 TaxID=1802630 RepID=A0A1F4VGB2_UNCKA|nr:MAG: hypothetical protein A3H26_01910 [candidate division WWE3 bacterium RIFCSPLOWO2_12_FULL_36_10]
MVSQTRHLKDGSVEEYFEHPYPPAMHQHSIRCTECGKKVVFGQKFFGGKRRGYCRNCGISWREKYSLGKSKFYGTRKIIEKRELV